MKLAPLFPTRSTNFAATALSLLAVFPLHGVPGEDDLEASEGFAPEAVRSTEQIKLPDGFRAELYAAEPLVRDPVAICFDEKGRLYVAESFRQSRGVEDNRGHGFWLLDDLAAQTVQDRMAMFRKWAHKKRGGMGWYTAYEDRVRLLTDRDGDGRADHATIFSDGYDRPLDGTGAGVLALDGSVYYTNIPHLWRLRDENGDGKADRQESLAYGFGVRVALRGHDMHGLVLGPDGRLYFSIGDRGYHVRSAEGNLLRDPGSGAVFRCELDGSNLEVFHMGLRNPQELAFDAFGNLFTADNNSDGGDKSRLVHCVPGGETAWDMRYQTFTRFSSRGIWTEEGLWQTDHPLRPAWVLPPLGHVGSGPSGFAHYPGVGLPEKYGGYFFMCDFRGSPPASGVHAWTLKPNGATYSIEDYHVFVSRVLATDVEFGYDGRVYLSDWVAGWGGNDRGRVHALHHPEHLEEAAETKTLFGQGFHQRSPEELGRLLAHRDYRVRLRAEFALVGKGPAGAAALKTSLAPDQAPFARLHALWGLGYLARKDAALAALGQTVIPLLQDPEPELRGQAAKVLGEAKVTAAAQPIAALLQDDSPRVRAFAAHALGDLGAREHFADVVNMLEENADRDAYLRHAGVMALKGMEDDEALFALLKRPASAPRMAAVLVLRKNRDSRLVRFLRDPDPKIAAEAVRAIHDLPLPEAFPALASLIETRIDSPLPATPADVPVLRRLIAANLREGKAENLRRLVRFAASSNNGKKMRTEALSALEEWEKPSLRDRVTGEYLPVAGGLRERQAVARILEEEIPAALPAMEDLKARLLTYAARYGLKFGGEESRRRLADPKAPLAARIDALQLLVATKDAELESSLELAMTSEEPALRAAALSPFLARKPGEANTALDAALGSSRLVERRAAYAALATRKDEQSLQRLDAALAKLQAGQTPPEERLDVLEAARQNASDDLRASLDAYEKTLPAADLLAKFRVTLHGGDAAAGRRLFVNHVAAQCLRCHAVDGLGGNAGPDLTKVGARLDREKLLESLIVPNAALSEGFGPASAMPPMGLLLKPREIRDLVEYLAGLK